MIKARVVRINRKDFDCLGEDGVTISCPALGNILRDQESVVVGDFVEVKDGQIIKVLPRTNEIFRNNIREGKRKITASNCDLLVIVMSASLPEYKRGLLDRYLVRAYQWDITPIIVMNKMDEYDSELFDIDFEFFRLQDLGIKTFKICAKDLPSLEELKNELKNKTSILVGQSGVGKSKIISGLTGGEISLKSAELGKVGKGAHTTTWCEIVHSHELVVIDSPGIRSFNVDDILESDLMGFFPDVQKVSLKCRFPNCTHEEDAKGCAFALLNPESARDKALLSRLDSFLRMLDEVAQIPDWQKKSQK
jgi:ribosome biogenesis GTPase